MFGLDCIFTNDLITVNVENLIIIITAKYRFLIGKKIKYEVLIRERNVFIKVGCNSILVFII